MREKSIGKTNLKIIAVFAVVIMAVVFISQLTGCGEEYRTVCVVETKGVVEAVKDKIVYPAYSGMMLQEGYSIETIGDSFVRLVLDGDKYVKLEPGSKLVCEALGTVGSGKTKLSLEKGSMTAELVSPLKDDEEFTVNTPNAVLAVRGTFFRVDLNEADDGDLVADVLTYGGQVAIQRILPTGKVVNEEVLIDAGFKVRVNMDTKNTVYVVDGVKTVEPDKIKVPEPISVQDIPDEDMVDIYFSVQNGHELFITEEETATLIEEREIQIEEYTPVYEKAEIVAEKLEAGEISPSPVIQDDEAKSRDSEDTGDPSEETSDKSSTKDTDTKESAKEDSKDKTKDTTKGTGTKTSTTIPVVDNTQTPPVVIPTTGTTETGGGETGNTSGGGSGGGSGSSSGGSGSGSGGSSGGGSSHTHSYTSSDTTAPTCTTTGVRTYTCSCGDSYTEDIPATGHHYTDSITKQPSCTGTGIRTYICTCGDSYTESIPALGGTHTPTDSGTNETTCSGCGERMVKINYGTGKNFANEYFCNYVKTNFDTDSDGYFTQEELDNVNTIDVSSVVYSLNLEGINFFRNVKSLKAVQRNLNGLFDFSGLQNLETIDISQCTGISDSVNLQGITTLQRVNIKGCSNMKGINVSNCPSLLEINVEDCSSLATYGINVTGSNSTLNIVCTETGSIYTGLPSTVTGLQSTMTFNGHAYP